MSVLLCIELTRSDVVTRHALLLVESGLIVFMFQNRLLLLALVVVVVLSLPLLLMMLFQSDAISWL